MFIVAVAVVAVIFVPFDAVAVVLKPRHQKIKLGRDIQDPRCLLIVLRKERSTIILFVLYQSRRSLLMMAALVALRSGVIAHATWRQQQYH